MDYEKAELEILENLDSGEITREDAESLLSSLESKQKGMDARSVETMHPDISATDRFMFQMFDDDPKGAMKKLQSTKPELTFRMKDGRVQARRPEEDVWQYVDPDKKIDPLGDPMGALKDTLGWTGIKEGMMDLTDVAYPLLSGVAETGAGIGGAIFGAPAGPPGMIGGAMVGAGTAGVGMDAARQGIGKALGYNQKDFDMKKSLVSGGLAAVVPGVLGPGAKIGTKAATKMVGRAKDAAKRGGNIDWLGGGFGRVRGELGAGAGALLSGRPRKELRDMSSNLDYIKRAEENPDITAKVLLDYGSTVTNASKSNVGKKGKALADPMFDDMYLETDPILKPLRELREEFMQTAIDAEGREGAKVHTRNAEKVIDMIDEVLEQEGTILQGSRAIKDFQKSINGLQQKTGKVFGMQDDPVKEAIHNRSRFAMTNFYSTIEKQGDVGVEFAKRNKDYAEAIGMDKFVNKNFAPDKVERTVRGMGSRTKTVPDMEVNKVLEELNVPMDDVTKMAKLQQVYANPSMQPVSFAGTTSTSMSNANQELAGAAMYQAAPAGSKNIMSRLGRFAASKAGSPWAMRKAAEGIKKVGAPADYVNKLPTGGMDANRLNLNTWLNMYNDN